MKAATSLMTTSACGCAGFGASDGNAADAADAVDAADTADEDEEQDTVAVGTPESAAESNKLLIKSKSAGITVHCLAATTTAVPVPLSRPLALSLSL